MDEFNFDDTIKDAINKAKQEEEFTKKFKKFLEDNINDYEKPVIYATLKRFVVELEDLNPQFKLAFDFAKMLNERRKREKYDKTKEDY